MTSIVGLGLVVGRLWISAVRIRVCYWRISSVVAAHGWISDGLSIGILGIWRVCGGEVLGRRRVGRGHGG